MWLKTFMIAGLVGLSAAAAGCDEGTATAAAAASGETAVVKGERAYAQSCAVCHGFNGQGMPNQGANLRLSKYIAGHTDDALVEFIRVGRLPADPNSTMKLIMPPNGGNPALSDAQLHEIVAYLRQVQREAGMLQTAGLSAAQ
jgi:disulfide bond formation protein DsbB